MTNSIIKTNSKLPEIKPEWKNIEKAVAFVLEKAKKFGVDSVEASAGYETGLSTTVRMQEVDTMEFHCDKSLSMTVYKGKKKGSVSTTDLSESALMNLLEKAASISNYTEEDMAAGLPDKENLATEFVDCDLYHPWDITPEDAIDLAKNCEAEALKQDKRLVNSEGASVSSHQKYRVYGNSLGFLQGFPVTSHSVSCVLIGKDKDDMQRDYDYTVARDPHDLDNIQLVAKRAADRTLRRLNAQKIQTTVSPVIFSNEIASGLIANFISAISGGNLYRKSSFLVDHLHKKVFPDFVTLTETPHLKRGLASAPFDSEGVKTTAHDIVKEGILENYVLSSYSARKLGLKTTGNCGGLHNLMVKHGDLNQSQLIKKMDRGLLITELLGHGLNLVTGDYSRGAAGFWIENGEIQYPVHEITVAGNLKDMFLNLIAIGNDLEKRSSILTGSILLDRMTIAGA